jgi:cytochrome c oxidase subunit I
MAVLTLAAGGALSFVLIQEKLAPLLSDTFFVPAYFHFLTVGTVTLTFLGALCYVIPALTGRPLWRPQLLAKLPYWTAAGVTLFGAAGVAAGYLGVPRRMLDITYEGAAPAAWPILLVVIGIGGTIMALALLVYVFGLLRTAMPRVSTSVDLRLPEVNLAGVAFDTTRAWTGPLSILVLVGAMALLTVLAFETMKALPLIAIGGGAH